MFLGHSSRESSVVGYLAYNGLLPLSTSSQVEILNQDFRAECLPKWLSGQEWKGVMGSSSHLGSPWMRQAFLHHTGWDLTTWETREMEAVQG